MSKDFKYKTPDKYRLEPYTVDGVCNTSYWYYFNKLLRMVKHIFKFENLPETWDKNYFLDNLYLSGYVVCFNSKVGNVVLKCSLSGRNLYGYPINWIVSNPILGNINGKLGESGELIYINKSRENYLNLTELIRRYAVQLATVDGSIESALINSRTVHVFEGNNDATVKTMQMAYDQASSGKPAIFIQTSDFDNKNHYMFNNVKNSYVGNDLYATKRSIMNEFLSEIGINNVNYEKKERLISDEVSVNQIELSSNIWQWKTCIEESINTVNKHFGFNITVDINDFGHELENLYSVSEESPEQKKGQED